MPAIASQSYGGEHDLTRATELLLQARLVAQRDRYPTLSRLRLLVSSRLWEAPNARLWSYAPLMDADAMIVGFALLWRRERESATLGCELVLHPTDAGADAMDAMVGWATTQAGEIARELGRPVTIGVPTFQEQAGLQSILARQGFAHTEGSNVYMARPLDTSLPQPAPPQGFSVRRLAGESELDAYTKVFGFAPMSDDHRREVLQDPAYSHLVAVGPYDAFVGQCECSIDREEWARGGRRTGWVEYVSVLEPLHGKGIGRALTAAGLEWMRTQGAETAALVTRGDNVQAQRAYQAAGFALSERDISYERLVAPRNNH